MFNASASKIIAGLALLLVIAPVGFALQDPTQPEQYRPARQGAALKLESILFSPDRRVAVINGKALVEGERLGNARVITIGKDSVRVQQGGKIVNLKLKRPTIRQDN